MKEGKLYSVTPVLHFRFFLAILFEFTSAFGTCIQKYVRERYVCLIFSWL